MQVRIQRTFLGSSFFGNEALDLISMLVLKVRHEICVAIVIPPLNVTNITAEIVFFVLHRVEA